MSVEVIEQLLNGVTIIPRIYSSNDLHELFMDAVVVGNLQEVKLLVGKGADVRANNDNAIVCASACGNVEVVRYLVGQGADVRGDDNGALRYAALTGNLEIVKFLVDKGAPITVAQERGTHVVQEFCKAYELKRKIEENLVHKAKSSPQPKKLKI